MPPETTLSGALIAILVLVGLMHLAFMVLELFPWPFPLSLKLATKSLPQAESFTNGQRRLAGLVSMIVHNAGVYNGIVAGGLLWAAFASQSAPAGRIAVARVMLAGAIAAGAFGAATLKSWIPAVQALAGLAGLVLT